MCPSLRIFLGETDAAVFYSVLWFNRKINFGFSFAALVSESTVNVKFMLQRLGEREFHSITFEIGLFKVLLKQCF